jgi:L-ribulose-5-phosphate 4-epimerase
MLEKLKEEVCKANKNLTENGLVIFTWGNVSAIDFERNIVAIKPSGVSFENLKPKDIVLVDLNGRIIEGNKKPSSDTKTHLEVYRNFKGVKAVVHTHSMYATIFAQSKKDIPCLGTTHADHFYGNIPVTRDLTAEEINSDYDLNTGKVIVEHFKKNKIDHMFMPACLVASHGPFVWGDSLNSAVENAVMLEVVAKMVEKSLQINPNIKPITPELLDKHYLRKNGINAYYGQPEENENADNNP